MNLGERDTKEVREFLFQSIRKIIGRGDPEHWRDTQSNESSGAFLNIAKLMPHVHNNNGAQDLILKHLACLCAQECHEHNAETARALKDLAIACFDASRVVAPANTERFQSFKARVDALVYCPPVDRGAKPTPSMNPGGDSEA